MKRNLTQLLAITLMCTAAHAAAPAGSRDFMGNIYDYIENLDVFELGQEEARAYYIPQHSMSLNSSGNSSMPIRLKGFQPDSMRRVSGIPSGI